MPQDHPKTTGDGSYPSPVIAWLWVGVLFTAYVCGYIDRQILSLMIDPIKADLHITDTQFSLLHGSSFALFYCLMGIPIGTLVDRYPRRHILAAGILLWSVMTGLCGVAGRYWQLFLARVGVGVGEASLSPCAYSLMADVFPPHRLGRAISVYTTGGGIGLGIAYIIGGRLVTALEASGPFDLGVLGVLRHWQVVFLIVAAPGIVIAAIMMMFNEPTRRDRAYAEPPPMSAFIAFLRSRMSFILPFFLTIALIGVLSIGVFTWMPSLLTRTYGMTMAQAGPLFGLTAIISVTVGPLLGSRIAEALAERDEKASLRAVLGSLLLTIPCAVGLALAPNYWTVLLFAGLTLVFSSAPLGVSAAILQQFTPNELRGRTTALYFLFQNAIAMTFGPLVPALFTDYAFGGNGKMLSVSLGSSNIIFGVLASITMIIAIRSAKASI